MSFLNVSVEETEEVLKKIIIFFDLHRLKESKRQPFQRYK
jgi:hypothetical protein